MQPTNGSNPIIKMPRCKTAFCNGAQFVKSFAEFAASAANIFQIIFRQGVYLAENTSQAASVELVRQRRTNSARGRLQNTVGKPQRGFPTV